MTERKTTGRLSIFQKLDTGDVPAPWVPPDLPAAKDAPGRAVAKRDPAKSPPPAPWVPTELPASNTAPAPAKSDRKVAGLKPWVPSAEAPRNLPATVADHHLPATVPDDETPEPKKRKKKRDKQRKGELTAETHQAGPTTINIVNQVAAPAPVYVSPWWGGWGGCPRACCPHRAGRTCWRLWCW